MGMFDYYEPVPALRCPRCGNALRGWQGKDGPCGMFVWRQGSHAPASHAVDPELALQQSARDQKRLPDGRLCIYTNCEPCRHGLDATVTVEAGLWVRSELETPENMRPFSYESGHEFRVRRARLAEFMNKEPVGTRTADDDPD